MQKIVVNMQTGQQQIVDMTPEEIEAHNNMPPVVESDALPNEAVVIDQGTGEPVKIIVKNGQVFVGGLDDETPA